MRGPCRSAEVPPHLIFDSMQHCKGCHHRPMQLWWPPMSKCMCVDRQRTGDPCKNCRILHFVEINQEDVNGEKLTVKKWWIFGADFSRFTQSFSRFIRDINGEKKKHLVIDDLFTVSFSRFTPSRINQKLWETLRGQLFWGPLSGGPFLHLLILPHGNMPPGCQVPPC